MALNLSMHAPRSILLVMLAALGGLGLWMLAPWGAVDGGSGSGSGNGGGATAFAPAQVRIDGPVQVESSNDIVTGLVVPLTLDDGTPITLDGAVLRAETAMSDTATAAVPTTFSYAISDGDGDTNLDPGEHAVLTIQLPQVSTVHPGNPLDLVLTTDGGRVTIEDVLP